MALARTKFAVGLFVVTGLGIAIVALVWLGMSRFLERGHRYVTYFDESVQGLGIDSAVKYRGVPVGRVERIGVAPDAKLIEVVLLVEPGQRLAADIVSQLRSVGITGSVFIELDRGLDDGGPAPPQLGFPTEHPIIPSRPSEIREILGGIDDLIHHVQSIDLPAISDKLKVTLDSLNRSVVEANVAGLSAQLSASLNSLDELLRADRFDRLLAGLEEASRSLTELLGRTGDRVDAIAGVVARVERLIQDNEEGIRSGIAEFGQAARSASALLETGSTFVGNADHGFAALQQQLLLASRNLQGTLRNLDRLVETLSHQPSQLLFSQPPEPRPTGVALDAK